MYDIRGSRHFLYNSAGGTALDPIRSCIAATPHPRTTTPPPGCVPAIPFAIVPGGRVWSSAWSLSIPWNHTRTMMDTIAPMHLHTLHPSVGSFSCWCRQRLANRGELPQEHQSISRNCHVHTNRPRLFAGQRFSVASGILGELDLSASHLFGVYVFLPPSRPPQPVPVSSAPPSSWLLSSTRSSPLWRFASSPSSPRPNL